MSYISSHILIAFSESLSHATFIEKFRCRYPDSNVTFYADSLECALEQLRNSSSRSDDSTERVRLIYFTFSCHIKNVNTNLFI